MTVNELRKALKGLKGDAEVTFWAKDTNMVYSPEIAYADQDGDLWIASDNDNYACYINESDSTAKINDMHISNLRLEGVKVLYDDNGDAWTIDEIASEMVKDTTMASAVVGPYYYSPREE